VSVAIAWSIRICRQPAANGFRGREAPNAALAWQTLIRAAEPAAAPETPDTRGRVIAWLSDPRRALLAAVLVSPAGRLDALSDPGRLVAHPPRRLDHRPTIRSLPESSSPTPRSAIRWSPTNGLSETIFAALAAVGGLFLVTALMGLSHGAPCSRSCCVAAFAARPHRSRGGMALGARAAEPVLGTRPQVFTFALVCWTLWIAESYLRSGGQACGCAASALPPLGEPACRVHRGHRLPRDRGCRGGDQAPMALGAVAPARRVKGLAVAVGASVLAACLNPYGPSLFVFAADHRCQRAAEGHHRVAVTELCGSGDVGSPGTAALIRSAHRDGARTALTAASLRTSRPRARGRGGRCSRSRRCATPPSASRSWCPRG